jgi:hypothetical protein
MLQREEDKRKGKAQKPVRSAWPNSPEIVSLFPCTE